MPGSDTAYPAFGATSDATSGAVTGVPRGRRLPTGPGLLAGLALFGAMAAWSLLTPLFAGPDETSNTVKAAAVVRGVWVGHGRPASVQAAYFETAVDIDPRFGNANLIPWCFAPYGEKPACDRSLRDLDVVDDPPTTSVGRYPPLAFAVPGLATLLGPTNRAVRLARLLDAAWAAALLGVGVAAARRAGTATVVLLAALSPMVLFLGSIVSPSGAEVCAALALWMVGPRLVRGELATRGERTGLWVVLVSLVAARPIGAVLAAVILAVCWAAHGGRSPLAIARRHLATTVSVLAVGALMGAWYVAVFSVELRRPVVAGQPSIGATRIVLRAAGHLPRLVSEMVGNFGWLDTPAPSLAVFAWVAAFAAIGGWAVARGGTRTRIGVAATVALTIALSVYLDADYYRILRNFGVQGRHLIPIAFGVVLLAPTRLHVGRRGTRAAAGCWVTLQFLCGLFALRRYAVGAQPDNFPTLLSAPVWRPVLGIWPTLALLAVTLVAVAGVLVSSEAAPAGSLSA